MIVFIVLFFLFFDFVCFEFNFGLFEVILVIKFVLVSLDKRLKVFLEVNGEWGCEIFCFVDFNVEFLFRIGLLWLFFDEKIGGGEIWMLLLIVLCELLCGFWGICLKMEVLE